MSERQQGVEVSYEEVAARVAILGQVGLDHARAAVAGALNAKDLDQVDWTKQVQDAIVGPLIEAAREFIRDDRRADP